MDAEQFRILFDLHRDNALGIRDKYYGGWAGYMPMVQQRLPVFLKYHGTIRFFIFNNPNNNQ